MARAAPTLCTEPRCGRYAKRAGRCAAHARKRPAGRYSPGWERIARAYLKRHRGCVRCPSRATTVDHVIPRSRGGTDDESNLQALCATCNGRKAAREDGGAPPQKRTYPALLERIGLA